MSEGLRQHLEPLSEHCSSDQLFSILANLWPVGAI